jgi:branched-chain amino acid transport system ATP-binding protein
MSAALRLEKLVAGYRGVPAVQGLDLEVGEGEIVALLGPNGAGKTTTLLTVVGFLSPISGSVTVLGTPGAGQRIEQIARLGAALVPEQRGVFYDLTVEENIRLRRRGKNAMPANAVLDEFPALRAIARRRAGLLSGGEQQMLALACALVAQPRLLMVDEMSHGLAPVIIERVLPTLRSAADERGTAILLVEQHTQTALAISDRAYVINRGRLVLEGRTSELRERPEAIEASYLDLSGEDAHDDTGVL